MRYIASCLIAVCLLAGCQQADEAVPLAPNRTLNGQPLERRVAPTLTEIPDFVLPTMTGDSLHIRDYRGKVVVLNYWATWCGPCLQETPELVALHNDLQDQGFSVIGISIDEEGFEVIQPFAEQFAVSYPMAHDDGTLADQLGGLFGLPTSYLLDQQGRIVHRSNGVFPFALLRPVIEELLQDNAATE